MVATVTNEADDYARRVLLRLRQAGLRAEADLRNEKIGYKVREHSLAKVPVMLVVGGREGRENTVAVRRLGSQAQESIALEEAVAKLELEGWVPAARASAEA